VDGYPQPESALDLAMTLTFDL